MASELHVLSVEDRKNLLKQSKEFDFIRFTFSDVNGISRSKLVAVDSFPKFVQEGVTVFVAAAYFGIKGEIPNYEEVIKAGYGNCIVIPSEKQIRSASWAGKDKYRVGILLCELRWVDDLSPQSTCPRYMARKQLENLEGIGYRFMSACEYEFFLIDPNTGAPVSTGPDIFIDQTFSAQEELIFDIHTHLKKAGVYVETLQSEYGPGQFELTMKPLFGIEGGDQAFLFKQGIKEVAKARGLKAVFMTKPSEEIGNSCHFNHSLWDLKGKSVMYDKNGRHCVSDVAQYWVGGILKHAKAITALCAPTVNCYRRLHNPWAPGKADYSHENRNAMCNMKNYGKVHDNSSLSAYIESRLPGGSATGYLLIAAYVAAGLDGIKNKITCPEPNSPEANSPAADELPHTLEEALQELEKDSIMVEALGKQFVTWYCSLKRKEIAALKDCDVKVPNKEFLEKERGYYVDMA